MFSFFAEKSGESAKPNVWRKGMAHSNKTGKMVRVTFWITRELQERFRAKVPLKRRSSYLRMCLEQIEDDIKFMELKELKAVKEYETWRHKIKMRKLEMEENYRKKEAFIK